MKKLLLLMLSLAMIFSVIGCGDLPTDEETEEIDPNRTQLYVGCFDGALGREWMKQLDSAFETAYADWVNPDNGKVGIQVIPNYDKTGFEDGSLNTDIANSQNAIYYLSSNDYDFIRVHFEDITDVVTTKIYDDNGDFATDPASATQSIVDTMYPEWRDMHKVNENGTDKYYAIPNWMSTPGITYDADLFEENDYEVPTTYNELIALMDQMADVDNITPFTFASTTPYIFSPSFYAIQASYEGKNNFLLNSTLDGYDTGLQMQITKNNGYELQGQMGKKAAIKFVHDLARKDAYTTSNTRAGTLNNMTAQTEFVSSITSTKINRVAMFIENSYWEREAYATFDLMASENADYGWGKRNFKYMPFPSFEDVNGIRDQENTKTTVLGATFHSMCAINKYKDATTKSMAKEFMKFAQSRKGLAIYVTYSSCLRAYKFTMTPEELALMTPYGRSLYELTQNANVEFVPYSPLLNDVFRKQGLDWAYNWQFETNGTCVGVNNDAYAITGRIIFQTFRANAACTVNDYFEGCQNNFNATEWAKMLNQ